MSFVHRLTCYIEDTDMGGIVYYVNYLKFFERARTELLRHLGFEQRMLQDSGYLFVVHSLECRYLKPACLDDQLDIQVVITSLSRTSLTFEQSAMRVSDGQVMCSASVRVACVDYADKRPCRIPSDIYAAFETVLEPVANVPSAQQV